MIYAILCERISSLDEESEVQKRAPTPELGTAITKYCRHCDTVKSVFAFSRKISHKDGLENICRKCKAIRHLNCIGTPGSEKRNKQNEKRRASGLLPVNRDKNKNSKLGKLYNLSLEEYDKMFESQKGLCKLCDKPETKCSKLGEVMSLSVHHSHVTGEIIGLFCSKCNMGMGLLKDSPRLLRRAGFLNQEQE